MTRDELIAQINALRALSTSSNPNEAAAAARIAEKKIQEYQLSQSELEMAPAIYDEEDADLQGVYVTGEREGWRADLAHNLADLHYCASISTYTPQEGVRVFGEMEDLATVKYLYAWLESEVARLALESGKSARWQRTFTEGAVEGIYRAMSKGKKEARKEATTTALVFVGDRQKSAEMQKVRVYGKVRGRRGVVPTTAAFDRGIAAGRKIVSSGEEKKRLRA